METFDELRQTFSQLLFSVGPVHQGTAHCSEACNPENKNPSCRPVVPKINTNPGVFHPEFISVSGVQERTKSADHCHHGNNIKRMLTFNDCSQSIQASKLLRLRKRSQFGFKSVNLHMYTSRYITNCVFSEYQRNLCFLKKRGFQSIGMVLCWVFRIMAQHHTPVQLSFPVVLTCHVIT